MLSFRSFFLRSLAFAASDKYVTRMRAGSGKERRAERAREEQFAAIDSKFAL